MAHRWCLPKVYKWETQRPEWDLNEHDNLFEFFRSLPKPMEYEITNVLNKHGGPSEPQWQVLHVPDLRQEYPLSE